MERNKFSISNIYPLLLYVVSKDEAVVVNLLYQELDEEHLYSETKIRFSHPTSLDVGAKINIAGYDISDILRKKTGNNTIFSGFNSISDANNRYYYKCLGYAQDNTEVDLLIPRHTYVKIKYLVYSISIHGGFVKSARPMFTMDKLNFIRIEKLELYGSRVMDHKNGISILKNAFTLYCGPKKYTVVESIGITKDIDNLDLRIPAPEYVFTKVYVDQKEVDRLYLDENNEILLIQFNDDEITIYTIHNEDDIHKLSTEYLIKEEKSNEDCQDS